MISAAPMTFFGLRPPLPVVRSMITGYDVTTPIELSIDVAADGTVALGGAPPLYHVATSMLPVFHSIRLVAVREGEVD